MSHINWYWEIQDNSSGPNYYLSLTFNKEAAEFRQQIENLLSKHYTSRPGGNWPTWVNKNGGNTACVNVYIHPSTTIIIELLWGTAHQEANELVQQLLSPPYAQTLVRWHVSAGGQGYASKVFGQGTDAASFLEYCQ